MSAEISDEFFGGGVSVVFRRVGVCAGLGVRRGICCGGGPVWLAERCGGRRRVLKAKLEARG
jgi:hypothetical protein